MRYLKAVGVGLLSSAAVAALYVAVKLGWSSFYMSLVLVPRAQQDTSGSWAVDYPQTLDIRGPLLIGFVAGFWWMLRRLQAIRG